MPGINGNGEKLTEMCKEKIILRIIVGNKLTRREICKNVCGCILCSRRNF